MSAILHRRELHVAITARESGAELAHAGCDVQAEFLAAFSREIDSYVIATCPNRQSESWPMQCRYIVDELPLDVRNRIGVNLQILVEHLLEGESFERNPT